MNTPSPLESQTHTWLTNRFALADDGWAHFVPKGEFPWKGQLIQVVDDESLQSLENTLPEELLIDQEHFSLNPAKESTAMGWVYGPDFAEIRPDGLYLHPKWTKAGLDHIAGGNLRYISPVFDRASAVPLGKDAATGLPRFRVMRMTEAALTNKPNLRPMKPLSNREHDAPGGEHGREKPAATKENHTTMKLVNRALDLSPDASEDAAAAGIEKLKNTHAKALADLANRDTELAGAQTELANRETEIKRLKDELAARDASLVEGMLDAAGITEADPRKRWKDTLLANRETGKALLDDYVKSQKDLAAAKAELAKPLTNRQTAKTPDGEKKELTGLARTQAALESEREQKGDN